MSRPENIVDNSKKHTPTNSQDTPVHGFDSDVHCRWPETEKDDDGQVADCIEINEMSDKTRTMERTPDELGSGDVDNVVSAIVELCDVTADSAVEE